jgi:hypothetical protein
VHPECGCDGARVQETHQATHQGFAPVRLSARP